jgi:hypothetical protein
LTFVVEDGTGLQNSNSYCDVDTADAYHDDRNNDDWASGAPGDKEGALVRATQYIEGVYRGRWPGTRVKYSQFFDNYKFQALAWPRWGAYDVEGFPLPFNALPRPLIYATCEAALRELVRPGVLSPDFNIPAITSTGGGSGSVASQNAGGLKREWAGDTGFEYYQASTTTTSSSTTAATSAASAATTLPRISVIDGIIAPILLSGNAIFGVTSRYTTSRY